MTEIKAEIVINAPNDKIWATLIDFASYPKWNPFIQDIQGKPFLNERLTVTIKPTDKNKMVFKPKIISMTEKKEFAWLGKLLFPGIFDGQHSFLLVKLSEDKTQLIHSERFSGILTKPILKLIQESTQAGFKQMNQALKVRCESFSS